MLQGYPSISVHDLEDAGVTKDIAAADVKEIMRRYFSSGGGRHVGQRAIHRAFDSDDDETTDDETEEGSEDEDEDDDESEDEESQNEHTHQMTTLPDLGSGADWEMQQRMGH